MKVVSNLILFIFILTSFGVTADDSDSSDEMDCAGTNHPAYQDEHRACLRLKIAARAKANGVDCVDCLFQKEDKGTSSIVGLTEALAQPLAMVLGTYLTAKYQNATQEAWAKAYASGYTECTNRFDSYLNYSTSVGANPISTTEATSLNASCNGNGYGSYAGYGGLTGNGYGGFGNPFTSYSGYTSGFMSGYGGTYATGTSSLYNNGMLSGAVGVSGTLTSSTTGVATAFGF